MKLWQLVSVMNRNIPVILTTASAHAEWRFVAEWLAQYDTIVDTQDRAKLDHELADHLVRITLGNSDLKCYLSNDGWLRSWRMSQDDKLLSALEAFDKYGGVALEEACEKGSVEVSHLS